MIYKDKVAGLDFHTQPARRVDDTCLNCSENHIDHDGWRCPNNNAKMVLFHSLSPDQRYLTQSMKDSIDPPTVKNISYQITGIDLGYPAFDIERQKLRGQTNAKATTKDISDWRAWKTVADDECKCGVGIKKSMCIYHKD